jgi:hypothetical protein
VVHENVGLYIVDGGIPTHSYMDYMWFKEGESMPLVRMQFEFRPGSASLLHCYINYDASANVEDIATHDDRIRLFPNPVTELLHIEADPSVQHYFIYDPSGRAVMDGAMTSTSFQVDVRSLPAGVYVLKMEQGGRGVAGRVFTKL